MKKILTITALLLVSAGAFAQQDQQSAEATKLKAVQAAALNTAPEPGAELVKTSGERIPDFDPKLPNVLLIGDSISQGYTRFVVKALHGRANVVHAPGNNGDSGTVAAGAKVWPTKFPEVKKWDVIHFNCGLHDLKKVKKVNGASKEVSKDPNDPPANDLARYEANLRRALEGLKATGAKLIFATTTPYPDGVSPARVPEDAVKYNAVAVKIMNEQGVVIDDLYAAVLPRLAELQLPVNVHFKPEGSEFLGGQVAQSIEAQLPGK